MVNQIKIGPEIPFRESESLRRSISQIREVEEIVAIDQFEHAKGLHQLC